MGYRTQLSADCHCVLHAAPVLEKYIPCIRIGKKGVQNQLGAGEDSCIDDSVLVRVVQVSKT